MLVQKKKISKKMLILWVGVFGVALIAGLFVYQISTSTTPNEGLTNTNSSFSKLPIPKDFGKDVFADPRLNDLEDHAAVTGMTEQYQVRVAARGTIEPPENLELFSNSFGGKVFISWSPSATDVTGYAVERATSGGSFQQIAFVSKDVTNYEDTNVINGQSYTYQVKSVVTHEKNRWNTIRVDAVTSGNDGVSAETASSSGVLISFASDDSVVAVKVFRARNGSSSLIATLVNKERNYLDTEGRATDTYEVIAFDQYAESDATQDATVTPKDTAAPMPPTEIKVTNVGDGNSVMITWMNPLDEDFDHVKIYRSFKQGMLGTVIKDERSNYYLTSDGSCVPIPTDQTERAKVGAFLTDQDGNVLETDCVIDSSSTSEGTTNYYTLTSVDRNGNESATNIVSPYGRTNPFLP